MAAPDRGEQEKRKELSPLASAGLYGAAGAQLAMSTVGFLLVGHYLDVRWGTSPWLAVTGLAVGFVGGLVNLVRIVRRFDR